MCLNNSSVGMAAQFNASNGEQEVRNQRPELKPQSAPISRGTLHPHLWLLSQFYHQFNTPPFSLKSVQVWLINYMITLWLCESLQARHLASPYTGFTSVQ